MKANLIRNKYRGLLLGLATIASAFGAMQTQAAEVPLGVYEGAGCTGSSRLPAFTTWLGRKPDRVLEFMSWQSMTELSPWSMDCWTKAGMRGRVTYSVPMLPENGSATLAQGAAGAFDNVFRQVATLLVSKGYGDTIIRLGWEFNGDWYAWAASRDPQSWIAYWRRIVGVMRSVPGANFKFDWCANGGHSAFMAQDAYPGDAYVDIIGLDLYNASWNPNVVTPAQRWEEHLNARHGLKWQAAFAAAHNKPISFPEWGTGTREDGHGAGDDPYYVEQMSEWIVTHNVVYHNYWDFSHPHFNCKLSDGNFPQSGAAFKRKFKLPRPMAPVLNGAQ